MSNALAQPPPNPHWDEIKALARAGRLTYTPSKGLVEPVQGERAAVAALFVKYSKAISNPELVEFVAAHALPSVIMSDAGKGYWGWLLQQRNIPVVAYHPYPRLRPVAGWVQIARQDRRRACISSQRKIDVLLMVAPENVATIEKSIIAYQGERIILITHLGPGLDGAIGALSGWKLEDSMPAVHTFMEPYVAYVYVRRKPEVNWAGPTAAYPQVVKAHD